MTDIRDMTAWQLRDAIAAGETTSLAATQVYLDAIAAEDGEIGAYNEVFTEDALVMAAAADAAQAAGEPLGLLHGVPIALKDNLCTLQGHTTCASQYLKDFRSPYEATVVARLRQAGAVFLGKTNMDEFAMGSSTENSSTHQTRNPHDLSRVPGGSSGGSAAAVAGRLCAAALGSDTGGSIRQPAAFCGVVGFKPTYGRVSRYGLVAYGSSLDQIGPLTRDIRDAAIITQVIAGQCDHDATSLPEEVADYLAPLDTPIEGLRIGLPREFYTQALGGEVRPVVEAAIERYREMGAQIVDVSLPHSRIDIADDGALSSFAVACYYIVATAEASSNLARFDGVHYGHRTDQPAEDIIELYSKSRAESLGAEVKRRIMLGTYALSSGYYDAYYNKALKVRRLIRNDFDTAFESCDVILAPTTPTPAFKLGENSGSPMEMYLQDVYTISANLAGIPGLAIPAGTGKSGLPVGIQLLGPVLSEPTLFGAGKMIERLS